MCDFRLTTDLSDTVREVYDQLSAGNRILLNAVGWRFEPRADINGANLVPADKSSVPLVVIPLSDTPKPRNAYRRGVPVLLAIHPLDPKAVVDPTKFQRFWLAFSGGLWILAGCQSCLRAADTTGAAA